LQLLASARRTIGLGQHQHHLGARMMQGRQGHTRELGRSSKGDPHQR
jgi:hypothetical protein